MKPLLISFRDKEVIIFGGGSVGKRKAGFFEDEANVHVFSESFVDGFEDMDLELVEKKIDRKDVGELIKDSFLVIAATDDHELNRFIAKEAEERGILVNEVGGEVGDVILPSSIERSYLLSISTLGKSPAFCKFLREKLEKDLGPEYDRMVRLQNEFRERLKDEISSQDKRRRILWKIMRDEDVWKCLRKNFYEKAVNRSEEILGEEHG